MTPQEKKALKLALIAGWRLLNAKDVETASRAADELITNIDIIADETEEPSPR